MAKDNQPKLSAAIEQEFLLGYESDFADLQARQMTTVDQGHGRRERRSYTVMPLPESMAEFQQDWKGLTSIGQVISVVRHREGRETADVRYYILSLPPLVKQFASSTRGHWSIENSLHWTLDMTFREDESRIRKDHGRENFATLRRFAIGLLKQDKSPGSIRRKRKRAAWNDQALLSYIQHKG